MGEGPVIKPATGQWLEQYRSHLLDRKYMSGIERDAARVKANAEIFTPDDMVELLVKKVGLKRINNAKRRIIDPACGDGQFLAYILYRRLRVGVSLRDALMTLHGIDIMPDNVSMCRERLCCGHDDNEEIVKIVNLNIVEADALDYHMRFDGTPSEDQIPLDLHSKNNRSE